MKKFRFITASAAAAALMLTACQNQEDFSQESLQNAATAVDDGSIQFGTLAGRETRSGVLGIINTAALQGGNTYGGESGTGFGVFAYNTGKKTWNEAANETKPYFMYNQNVLWDGTDKWTYDPVKYWPNNFNDNVVDAEDKNRATGTEKGSKLSFFAYAPYVDLKGYTESEKKDLDKNWDGTPETPTFLANDTTYGISAITWNEQAGDPLIKYTLVKASSKEAVDLLWGTRGNTTGYDLANATIDTPPTADGSGNIYNTDLTKQTVSEKVNFLFKHALAKMGGHLPANSAYNLSDAAQTGLQVILDIDNGQDITGGTFYPTTLVTIKSVQVQDLYSYTVSNDDDKKITVEKSDLINAGWFDFANGTWSNTTNYANTGDAEANNTTYDSGEATAITAAVGPGRLNADIAEPSAVASSASYDASVWKLDGTTAIGGVTTTAKDVYTAESDVPSVFMIPSEKDQTFVVTVTYIVRTFDAKLSAKGSDEGTWTKVTQTITNKVTIPGNSLQPNKFYKLLMHLGLTSIKFEAKVADWDEAGNTDSNNDGKTDSEDGDADKGIYLPSNTLSSTSVSEVESGKPTTTRTSINVNTNSTVYIKAEAESYSIKLTGIDYSSTVAISAKKDGTELAIDPTYVNVAAGQSTADIDIDEITANTTTKTVKYVITLQAKDGTDGAGNVVSTTTLTIEQEPKALSITSDKSSGIAAAGETITLTPSLTVAAADTKSVTIDGTATTPTFDDGKLKISIPANKTAQAVTYSIVATVNDATSDAIKVTQLPAATSVTASKSSGIVAVGETIVLTVKDGDGKPVDLMSGSGNAYTVSVVDAEDNSVACTAVGTSTGIALTIPKNAASSERTLKITVTVNGIAANAVVSVSQNAGA